MPPIVIDLRRAEDTRDVVHRAVQALAEGQLVAFPTETVYGLAASACHGPAVEKLAAAKGRPKQVPFALAIKSAAEASDYVPDLTPLARRLARRCWPGPVTLVVDDAHPDGLAHNLPPAARELVCPNGTLGLRVPASPTLLDVLRMLAGPLALTSANRSGQPDPVNARQVIDGLDDDVALILDEGPCRYGQPSTVVRIRGGEMELLREGVVAESTLRRLASVLVVLVCTGNTCRSPMAELLMRKKLAELKGCDPAELDDRGVLIVSAGLAAAMGAPPSTEAVEVMRGQGLDLTRHEAQPLTDQLVRQADLILTMTESHRRAVVGHWPEASERTQLVLPGHQDVADPIGCSIDVYRRCADQLREGVSRHATEIEQMS